MTDRRDAASGATVRWTQDGAERSARWLCEAGSPAPERVVLADDRTRADDAYRLVCEGTALLWCGDFHGARQLLDAIARRVDRGPRRSRRSPRAPESNDPAGMFHRQRQHQAQRARRLGMVLVPLDAEQAVPLRRAPDVRRACAEAYGEANGPAVVPLRELLGVIGAREWRARGIEIESIGARIRPHYGVFAPTRTDYVDLVARAPLPAAVRDLAGAGAPAYDIGTGTAVLAATLAARGVARIVATDQDERALTCARENVERLGYTDRIEVVRADLFPPGRAGLVICNPPWLPVRPSTRLDQAVYDPGSRMLRGFLNALDTHLLDGAEGWLILSDLAELLELRSRAELEAAFSDAGLAVRDRIDAAAGHPRARDGADPLHRFRMAETVSLWRLGAAR